MCQFSAIFHWPAPHLTTAGRPPSRRGFSGLSIRTCIVQHSGAVCQAALVRKTRLVCARDPGSANVARFRRLPVLLASCGVFAVALAIRSVETPGGWLLPSGPRFRVTTLFVAKKTFPSPLFCFSRKSANARLSVTILRGVHACTISMQDSSDAGYHSPSSVSPFRRSCMA